MSRTTAIAIAISVLALHAGTARASGWAKPLAAVIPHASGYVPIPTAAVLPAKSQRYWAIFDAARAADKPTETLPALDNAGSELNALGAAHVPLRNVKFVIVFHGAALDGILDGPHYKAKFGRANPNLELLSELRRAGVELYVCGQNLALLDMDPRALSPDVKLASDALIVLMTYQSKGYGLLSF